MARWLLLLAIVIVAPFAFVRITRKPSNARAWHPTQRVLPRVTVDGNRVVIRNVRDFTWRTATDFERRYETRTYDLSRLDSVWYVVSRFGGVPGLAHAFLSFGFGDEYIAMSVEARKEAGQSYSPLRGLFRQYELMYVIGSERDVIGVRTHVWREDVSLYPIRTTPELARRTFLDMALRAEKLANEPEFYNTLTSSCTSNIVEHVNAIVPDKIGFSVAAILPGLSDRLAWRLGLIDSDLPFDRMTEAFRIPASVRSEPLDAEFSRAIRKSHRRHSYRLTAQIPR